MAEPALREPTLSTWTAALRRHLYTLFRAPRGIGRPQSVAAWDREYAAGKWRTLDSAAQIAHYAVIAGYVGHLFPTAPRILDVGCGHGRLQELLRRAPYASYVGLDLSPTAIATTQAAASPNTRFEVADFTTWRPEHPHDVIIFNESIYYARDPIAQLTQYAGYLAAGGVMVLSMVRSSMNAGIARRVRRHFETLHSSVIRNEHGDTWEVSVIRPIG